MGLLDALNLRRSPAHWRMLTHGGTLRVRLLTVRCMGRDDCWYTLRRRRDAVQTSLLCTVVVYTCVISTLLSAFSGVVLTFFRLWRRRSSIRYGLLGASIIDLFVMVGLNCDVSSKHALITSFASKYDCQKFFFNLCIVMLCTGECSWGEAHWLAILH